jgi:YidC/Oxa1 family membrane protein insertase
MSRRTLKTVSLLGLTLLLVAACGDAGATVSVSPTPFPDLVPAAPGADPFSLLAWLFTPVFQALFVGLVLLDRLTGDIGISILILTLIIRIILISPYRKQLVSQKRTQLLAPEVAEIQRRYKGDKVKIQQAQMELYKSRGVSPFGGCLPTLLQFIVLIPMYTVISNGLTTPNPMAMLSVFGFNVGEAVGLVCVNGLGTATYDNMKPCIEATVPWLGGLNASLPSVIDVAGFGLSILAVVSALLQVIQTRMMINPNASKNDPMSGVQGQTMVLLPLISVLYGGILPAGLFIYWIASTLFSIGQQYLILGYGGLFPLFGWTPAFAVNHTPRFPVAMPELTPDVAGKTVVPHERTELDRAASAAATIRSAKKRDRHGRRGSR